MMLRTGPDSNLEDDLDGDFDTEEGETEEGQGAASSSGSSAPAKVSAPLSTYKHANAYTHHTN